MADPILNLFGALRAGDLLAPWAERAKAFGADEDGAVIPFLLLMMPVFLWIAAFGQSSTYRAISAQLQTTVDAAALAASTKLPDAAAALAEARRLAQENMGRHGGADLIPAANLTVGRIEDGQFVADADGNAVRVVGELSVDNGNAIDLDIVKMLTGKVGEMQAEAVAVFSAGASATAPAAHSCVEHSAGFTAHREIRINAHSTVSEGACLFAYDNIRLQAHGRVETRASLFAKNRIALDAHSRVERGAEVVLPSGGRLSLGAHAYVPTGVVKEEDRESGGSLDVAQIFDDFVSGAIDLPDFLDGSMQTVSQFPRNPVPGRTYILTGSGYLPPHNDYANVGIIVPNSSVYVASHTTLYNVMILAQGSIALGAHMDIGNDACNGGDTALFVTKSDLQFHSHVDVSGAQFLADRTIRIHSHVDFEAVSVVGRDISFGAHVTLDTCADGSHPAFILDPDAPQAPPSNEGATARLAL